MESSTEHTIEPILDEVTKQKIESRFNQSNGSRLAEIFTGFTPEDPRIIDKLIEIQDRIYQKYSLPDIAISLINPEYLNQKLNQIITDNNITILTQKDTQEYFNKYPQVYAVYFNASKSIGINTERQQDPDYSPAVYYMSIFHEIVHGLQDRNKDFDLLSIEMLEFEATIASTTLSPLKNTDLRAKVPILKEAIVYLFDSMYVSIENWEKQGGITNKPHYSAENILRVFDNITTEQIDSYKKNFNNPQG